MRSVVRQSAHWARRHPVLSLSVVIVGVLAVGGVAAWRSQRTSKANEHWETAKSAQINCNFAVVRAELTELVRIQPGDGRAHFDLARACRRDAHEDFSLAETHLKRAYDCGIPPAEIHFENRLLDYQRSGESGEIENVLKSQLDRRPESQPLILEALARGCMRSSRMSAAGDWLNRWVKDFPDDWYARLWRGSYFQHINQMPLAIEDYRQVLRHQPERRDVRRRLGLALAASGYDFQEARGYLEEALQNDAEDLDAKVLLAHCLHIARQSQQAKELLTQVLAAQPDHVEALFFLAEVEVDLHLDREALRVLRQLDTRLDKFDVERAQERLLRLDPVAFYPQATKRMESFLHLQGTVLRRLGREGEARNIQKKLEHLQENSAALSQAMQQYQGEQHNADLMFRIGALQRELGRDEEGLKWLKKAIQLEPAHRQAHQALSEYYETQDDPQAKLRAAEHRGLAKGQK